MTSEISLSGWAIARTLLVIGVCVGAVTLSVERASQASAFLAASDSLAGASVRMYLCLATLFRATTKGLTSMDSSCSILRVGYTSLPSRLNHATSSFDCFVLLTSA